MTNGATVNGVVYLGTPWVDEVRRTTVKVNLCHVPLSYHGDLGQKLLPTMQHYGKVLQIRKYTNSFGKFCGEASVILDRGDDLEDEMYPELSRMIFLEEEDIYISASYQGAPRICFHCRIAGHERQECPELASVQCFGCKGLGHIRRHCKKIVESHMSNNDKHIKVATLDAEEPSHQQEVKMFEGNMVNTSNVPEHYVEPQAVEALRGSNSSDNVVVDTITDTSVHSSEDAVIEVHSDKEDADMSEEVFDPFEQQQDDDFHPDTLLKDDVTDVADVMSRSAALTMSTSKIQNRKRKLTKASAVPMVTEHSKITKAKQNRTSIAISLKPNTLKDVLTQNE